MSPPQRRQNTAAQRRSVWSLKPGGPWEGPSTIVAVQDYATAWTAEGGRCHRLIYGSEDGHPEHVPEPTVTSGWRRDGQGRWYAVDSCAGHSSQLVSRPRPPSARG